MVDLCKGLRMEHVLGIPACHHFKPIIHSGKQRKLHNRLQTSGKGMCMPEPNSGCAIEFFWQQFICRLLEQAFHVMSSVYRSVRPWKSNVDAQLRTHESRGCTRLEEMPAPRHTPAYPPRSLPNRHHCKHHHPNYSFCSHPGFDCLPRAQNFARLGRCAQREKSTPIQHMR
jgi:hypothetical protein